MSVPREGALLRGEHEICGEHPAEGASEGGGEEDREEREPHTAGDRLGGQRRGVEDARLAVGEGEARLQTAFPRQLHRDLVLRGLVVLVGFVLNDEAMGGGGGDRVLHTAPRRAGDGVERRPGHLDGGVVAAAFHEGAEMGMGHEHGADTDQRDGNHHREEDLAGDALARGEVQGVSLEPGGDGLEGAELDGADGGIANGDVVRHTGMRSPS